MTDPILDFEAECAAAGVAPAAAVQAAGMNRSTWFRWKSQTSSPTLRSLASAREGLAKLVEQGVRQPNAHVSLEKSGVAQ